MTYKDRHVPVFYPYGEKMNIKKLTILPLSKHYTATSIINPDREVVRQALLKTTQKILGQPDKLPDKIIKRIAKEHSIPSYINHKAYVGSSKKTPVEDARVWGGAGFDYFG